MTDQEQKDVERVMTAIKVMRKYQNRFFGGDKSVLKTAKFYENQADNDVQNLILKYKLTIVEPKGPPAQGTLM